MYDLIDDFNKGVGEDDLAHLPEILALHDLELDPEAGNLAAFHARSARNSENRCLHHHVFDTRLAVSLIDYMGLQIKTIETIRPMHILVVAQKVGAGNSADNSSFAG